MKVESALTLVCLSILLANQASAMDRKAMMIMWIICSAIWLITGVIRMIKNWNK